MKILITGGNGFVGIHLLRRLSAGRHQLAATWFESPPAPEVRSEFNKTRWFPCDLSRSNPIRRIVRRFRPNAVIHLAAQASVAHSWRFPRETFGVNSAGTIHLLEALKELGKPCRVLAVESGEVYGRARGSGGKITERTPLAPENPYAASKAAQDLVLYPYLRSPFLNIIRVRPMNHTGPGQSPAYVVASFASQIAAIEAGKTPAVLDVGNLKAERDFTDVRDVVRAYELLLKKGKGGEVYNVASGKAVSIESLLKRLLKRAAQKIHVRRDPARFRPNDIPRLVASPAKLRRATGWRPEIPLDRSLDDTLQYWRGVHSPT